jgi:hypothetical protein
MIVAVPIFIEASFLARTPFTDTTSPATTFGSTFLSRMSDEWHSRFVGLREDKKAMDAVKELDGS